MRGTSSLILVVAAAACLAAAGIRCSDPPGRPLAPPAPLPFPSTTSNIHLGLAFDYAAHDPRALAASVDYVFGGYFVDWNFGVHPRVRHVDAYLPFDTDPTPQSVAGHSLSDWKATHPDWIVYRCDRKTPAYYGGGNTNVPIDFTNPAVRAWQLREAATMFARGATGIAFDDFTFANFAARCGVYRNGAWIPLRYPGLWQRNAKYSTDMLTWLHAMRAALRRHFPTKTVTVNMNLLASGFTNLTEVAPYVDMVFDEGGFTSYGAGNLSDSAWQREVDALEYLNSRGKAFDVNGIVRAPSDADVAPAEINWVLANYLLVKGSHSYTYIYARGRRGVAGSPSGYGTFYDRPQYHVQIGQPTSSRFQSDGAELRCYSGGLVIVNPSGSQTDTVQVGNGYRDLFDRTFATATLPPSTAIVLVGEGVPHGGASRCSGAPANPSDGDAKAIISGRPGGRPIARQEPLAWLVKAM